MYVLIYDPQNDFYYIARHISESKLNILAIKNYKKYTHYCSYFSNLDVFIKLLNRRFTLRHVKNGHYWAPLTTEEAAEFHKYRKEILKAESIHSLIKKIKNQKLYIKDQALFLKNIYNI